LWAQKIVEMAPSDNAASLAARLISWFLSVASILWHTLLRINVPLLLVLDVCVAFNFVGACTVLQRQQLPHTTRAGCCCDAV
jgi:hypothetical protein